MVFLYRLVRTHIVPTLSHEIFLFQKFGQADKTSILEQLGDDVKKWVDLEIGMEKRTHATWYNVPASILAQLVWKVCKNFCCRNFYLLFTIFYGRLNF